MEDHHQVLVKITEVSSTPSERIEERVGDALIVRDTVSEESDTERIRALPAGVTTAIRIVAGNPALDAERHETLSKAMLIGKTWIETIETGIAVPA